VAIKQQAEPAKMDATDFKLASFVKISYFHYLEDHPLGK